jgi:hypothetical protein
VRSVRRVQRPRFGISGDYLATWDTTFGLLEPNCRCYGTEGQRFESSRARFVSREKLPANRHFLGGADVLGGWQHRGQQGNSAGRW